MWTPLPGYAGILFVLGLVLFGCAFVCAIAWMFARGFAAWIVTMFVPSRRRQAARRKAEQMADLRRRRQGYESKRKEAIYRVIRRTEREWLAEHPEADSVPMEVAEALRSAAWAAHPFRHQDY